MPKVFQWKRGRAGDHPVAKSRIYDYKSHIFWWNSITGMGSVCSRAGEEAQNSGTKRGVHMDVLLVEPDQRTHCQLVTWASGQLWHCVGGDAKRKCNLKMKGRKNSAKVRLFSVPKSHLRYCWYDLVSTREGFQLVWVMRLDEEVLLYLRRVNLSPSVTVGVCSQTI